MNAQKTGWLGEMRAAAFLRGQGMRILKKRWRTAHGEIDLIMRDGDNIVFVEVKTRKTGRPGDGLTAVDRNKQKRIVRAATIYLMTRHLLNAPVRFDLVEICRDQVLYIPNAFQPGGQFYH